MNRIVLPVALITCLGMAFGLQGQAFGADRSELRACMQEAKWPIFVSHGYVDGSAHARQQILNSYNTEVASGQSLCVGTTSGQGSPLEAAMAFIDAQRNKYGPSAATHLDRLATHYTNLLKDKG